MENVTTKMEPGPLKIKQETVKIEPGTIKIEAGSFKIEPGTVKAEQSAIQTLPSVKLEQNKVQSEQSGNENSPPLMSTNLSTVLPVTDVTTSGRPKRHSAMVAEAKRRAIFNRDKPDDGEPTAKASKRSHAPEPLVVKKKQNQKTKGRKRRAPKKKPTRKTNSVVAIAPENNLNPHTPSESTPRVNTDQTSKPCNELTISENVSTDSKEEKNQGDDNVDATKETAPKADEANTKQDDNDEDYLPDPDDADCTSDTESYIDDSDELPSDIGDDSEVIDGESDDDYVPTSFKSKKTRKVTGAASRSTKAQPYSSLPSCTVTKATAEIIDEIDISDSTNRGENCSILATPSLTTKSKSAFDVLRSKNLSEPKTPKGKHNARFYFNQEHRASVRAEVGGPAKVVNQALTERWNKLTFEERSKYDKLADADAKRFNIEHDDYLAEVRRNKEILAAEEKKRQAEEEERSANMEAVRLQQGSFQEMLAYVKKSRKAFKELQILDEHKAAEQRKSELLQARVPLDAANLKQSIGTQIMSQMKYFRGIKYSGGSIRVEVPNVSQEIYDHIFQDISHISDPDTFFGKTYCKSLRYGALLTITNGLTVRYTKASKLLVISGGYSMDNCGGGGWGRRRKRWFFPF